MLKVNEILHYNQLMFMHKFRNGALPQIFNRFIKYLNETGENRNREHDMNYKLPADMTKQKFPLTESILTWNRLPHILKFETDTLIFKKELKEYLLFNYKDFECLKEKCFSCGTKD